MPIWPPGTPTHPLVIDTQHSICSRAEANFRKQHTFVFFLPMFFYILHTVSKAAQINPATGVYLWEEKTISMYFSCNIVSHFTIATGEFLKNIPITIISGALLSQFVCLCLDFSAAASA